MGTVVVRYADRPELWDESDAVSREVWPEYNLHGDVLNRYWGRLFDEFPEYQFVLFDDEHNLVVAEGHMAPCNWDGTTQGLGEGIDAMLVAAFTDRATGVKPTALCALAAEVRPQFQGFGLAPKLLESMAAIARDTGQGHLIAPVRPSLKHRYPIIPIERYLAWTAANGEPFDPWIRVHARLGGVIAKPAPRSVRITGTISEWEQWTKMAFPGDGDYTFPGGLALLTVDYHQDRGSYWEPNVWIVHSVSETGRAPAV